MPRSSREVLHARAVAAGLDLDPSSTPKLLRSALIAAGVDPDADPNPPDPDEVLDDPVPVRVDAIWDDDQSVFVPKVGIVERGDRITVTAEQLEHDPRLLPAPPKES